MPRITRRTIAHIEHVATILNLTSDDAWNLRRCAMTLHRWHEAECGDSNATASWCIERDESTGKPYMVRNVYAIGRTIRTPIRDMERGAMRRVEAICKRNGLHYYVQTDPRGGTLYLDRKPIPENNYTRATFLA